MPQAGNYVADASKPDLAMVLAVLGGWDGEKQK
jgi:hypothetical protein